MMKMVAYLFAGADSDQLALLKHGCGGIIAKLSVLSPAMLGEADTPAKLCRLYLLDIDPTSIPSSQRGIILPGNPPEGRAVERQSTHLMSEGTPFEVLTSTPDFTSHLEPAWGFDTTLCLVAYRYRGRLIQKINPLVAEAAVLEWWNGSEDLRYPAPQTIAISDLQKDESEGALHLRAGETENPRCRKIYTALPSDFEGGRIHVSMNRDPSDEIVALIASANKPKARTCLAAMYEHLFADKRADLLDINLSRFSPEVVAIQTMSGLVVLL